MKVLMIGPFPPILNGVTVSNDFLSRNLIENGWDVSAINTETGKIASLQGDKISFKKILTFLSIYIEIYKVFSKDVVYMTTGQTFWGVVKYLPFVMLCKVLSTPYVLHVHGGYICQAYLNESGFKKQVFGYIVNKSKAVIALSDSLATEIKHVFGTDCVEVIENFYDPRLLEPTIQRTASPIPRFLFLSNLMLGKGILDFLDALILLQDTHHIDFTVCVAGTMEKGIEKNLQTKIQHLGAKVLYFDMANFEKKKELLYNSDIFVLPTWYIMEGQPISIIEAYVTGNIVVSTDQGGIKDISNYPTFFKTQKQDSDALARVLIERIATRNHFIQKSIEVQLLAQKRFNPKIFIHKIQDCFLKLKA